jgi:5'-nucleotidase
MRAFMDLVPRFATRIDEGADRWAFLTCSQIERCMRPMVLLINDDGVSSVGIWAAYKAIAPIADITVVAPATQQSAVGRSISIFEPLRTHEIRVNGVKAFAVGGTPTDAVIIGLYALSIKPDLVVSGINIGENLSFESIMTSGTVGAALEAANQGTPAVAFSLQVEDQGEKFDDPRQHSGQFDKAIEVVRDICGRILSKGFPQGAHVVNVNIPSKGYGSYEITRLAEKLFITGVEKRLDPRGRPYYWINGPLLEDAPVGTDVHAVRKGNVSITPITLDCTAPAAVPSMKDIFLT